MKNMGVISTHDDCSTPNQGRRLGSSQDGVVETQPEREEYNTLHEHNYHK